ncbi:C3a anaphylatoxin chemotactic receptor-like [Puntigrus tetrazona]|uniref:C3a anaphylatoxin chemotactic receptor-like n=1 Tax=Puntigrus tetrazona TaxID=1606681 RepID=UPI001C8A10EA|nr:C3a anaphylatoxin chemotactic receptor-like [Puntigrus tetrazona]
MTSNKTLLLHSPHHGNTTVDTDTEDIVNKVSIVFLTTIVLFGTTGNSLVIWVAGFRMKPNVTNVWLVNLAVADLIFSLTRVLSLIRVLFYKNFWPFGLFLCKFTGFFKYANMFCSVFLLAVISVDRVLCIWRPVLTRKRRTLCAARVVSVGVWIMAVIFSSPYFVYRQVYSDENENNLNQCSLKEKGAEDEKYVYYCIRFICGFLLPFLVILICYILAAVGIRRTRLSGKSRPLRILAVLVCAFFLCWAPYHFLGLVKLMNEENKAVKEGWTIASDLAYFNSCINPVLYFCMGLDVRRRCNQNLSGIFHRALTEEGQSLSRQGSKEESHNSVSRNADTGCESKV